MRSRVAIVYNQPGSSSYDIANETKAAYGVLEAVESVHGALSELGCEVLEVPLDPPIEQATEQVRSLDVDLIFNLFEGFCGYPETEAHLASALAKTNIPYTGCPNTALKTALDKARVNMILRSAGIPTPDYQILGTDTIDSFRIEFPCIVKPRCEDASHGLTRDSVVHNLTALKKQISLTSTRYRGGVLVEHFLDGREFNVTVMGNSRCTVLPVSEIAYSLSDDMPRLLTYESKWDDDSRYFKGTKPVCPADLSPAGREQIVRIAKKAFHLIIGRGYARVDMRMDEAGRINIIDVNPNPDISPGAGAVLQSEKAGMSYPQFINRIVQLALKKESL